MHIPKIVHQTWKDRRPHAALQACIESFRFMNPNWDVRYYTDDDCVAWVRKICPRLESAYMSFPTGIHRADLFRILVLYFDGGVYADIDVECLRPLDELISRLDSKKAVFLTRDHPAHERIHFAGRPMFMNDFMIAEPSDPLIEQILKWMLRCPPLSKSSADAVMDTGPGVMSSVIEMLGGPAEIPSLQVMPTPWIHPLPDMNCQFPESQFYRTAILSRDWLKPEVCVVHYWFHTWVGGVTGNTLTDNAEVLLSTLGEQVERKLQWHLGESPSEIDCVLACAVAECAESRATVLLYVDRDSDPLMDAFLGLLQVAGIKPKMHIVAAGGDVHSSRVRQLEKLGAGSMTVKKEEEIDWDTGWTSSVVLIASPDSSFDESDFAKRLKKRAGFVLGPGAAWASPIAVSGDVHLSEIVNDGDLIPRVVHLLPSHGISVPALAERLSAYEFSVRQWTLQERDQLLADSYLGTRKMEFVPEEEIALASLLAILHVHGGVAFQGDADMMAAQLDGVRTLTYCGGKETWLLACPAGSTATEGALPQLQSAIRKNGLAGLKAFLPDRMKTLQHAGVLGKLGAKRIKAHALLP